MYSRQLKNVCTLIRWYLTTGHVVGIDTRPASFLFLITLEYEQSNERVILLKGTLITRTLNLLQCSYQR